MTSYRGIDKTDLLKSIFAAKKFIMDLHLGPATEEWFNTWVGTFPYAEIRNARSTEELVSVMKSTGVREAFFPFQDVFAYHGMAQLADDSEDMEDTVPQLYADLAIWGAFQNVPVRKPLLDALKKEIDNYLIVEGFIRVADDMKMHDRHRHGADLYPTRELIRDTVAELRKYKANEKLAEWLEMVVPVFSLLKQTDNLAGDNEVEIINLLEDAPLNGRFYLKQMLCKMTGLDGWRLNVMDVPRPIMLYGVEPGDVLSAVGPLDEVMASLRGKLGDVLKPYTRQDEAQIKGEGFTNSQAKRPTVFFNATARVAQQVANQLHDVKVIRYEGLQPQEIKPQLRLENRPPPAPGMP